VRDMRRRLFPQQGCSGGGRWGHRRRGGDLPHEIREQGHHRAPAGPASGLQDHGRPRLKEQEDRFPLEHRDHGHPRSREERGHRGEDPQHPGRHGGNAESRRCLHRDRARSEYRDLRGTARDGKGLPRCAGRVEDQCRRRLRRRRRPRLRLPPGGDRGRLRMPRRHRRGAVARIPGAGDGGEIPRTTGGRRQGCLALPVSLTAEPCSGRASASGTQTRSSASRTPRGSGN